MIVLELKLANSSLSMYGNTAQGDRKIIQSGRQLNEIYDRG